MLSGYCGSSEAGGCSLPLATGYCGRAAGTGVVQLCTPPLTAPLDLSPWTFLSQVLVGIDFVTYYFISCLYIDYKTYNNSIILKRKTL